MDNFWAKADGEVCERGCYGQIKNDFIRVMIARGRDPRITTRLGFSGAWVLPLQSLRSARKQDLRREAAKRANGRR